MNINDHAILIGINSYPELGEGGLAANLNGPGNDVDAVKAWLIDPKGGALPPGSQNIHELRSQPALDAANARPTVDELDALLARIDAIAMANRKAGKGQQVGRRLYLYMSGHGFSPGRQRACLFTANAKERLGLNVHATGWLNWLQDSGYFREFVLWVDACMNRMSFLQPHDPPLPPVVVSNPPLANFVAFAAQRPLKAVEQAIAEDGNKAHGIFTWTLLEGLRGAAADANGRVTGTSLANWVRNAQSARFSPEDRDDRDVAQEPEIVQQDAGLIFARGVAPPEYPVTLIFPAAAQGATARLWSGSPPAVLQTFPAIDSAVAVKVALRPGLYVVDVPPSGLRHGFEVVCPMAVVVQDTGPAVVEVSADAMFELDIDPGDPTAEIFVIDRRFSLVDSSPARLATPLPAGVFKIKIRIGNAVNQRVILLDHDRPSLTAPAAPQLPSLVVPMDSSASSHESHRDGRADAVRAANALTLAAGDAVVLVMARQFSDKLAPRPGLTPPWQGISIVDALGNQVIDLATQGERHEEGDAYAHCASAVAPGCYYLRQRLDDGQTIEQSLIVCAGWRTEAYVLRGVTLGAATLQSQPRVSVMMHRLGQGLGDEKEDRLVETAAVGLAGERRILNAELESLLLEKFSNPVTGMIGGHLLLVERERDPARDISQLDAVVRNLIGLVGANHPDVAALALQCADARLRPVGRLAGPPMLHRSWALLAQGAAEQPELIPAAMWSRVHALAALAPFLVWTTEEAVKAAARQQLAQAILRPTQASSPAAQGPMAFSLPGADATLAAVAAAVEATQPRSRGVRAAPPSTPPGLGPTQRARAAQLNVPPSAFEALQSEVE